MQLLTTQTSWDAQVMQKWTPLGICSAITVVPDLEQVGIHNETSVFYSEVFLHSRRRFQYGFVAEMVAPKHVEVVGNLVNTASIDNSIGMIRKYTLSTAISSFKCTCLGLALKGH